LILIDGWIDIEYWILIVLIDYILLVQCSGKFTDSYFSYLFYFSYFTPIHSYVDWNEGLGRLKM